MFIENGKGDGGFSAGVTADSMLETCSVTRTVDLYCNQKSADSYSCIVIETPTTSGSCFCYIKNNYDKDMVMSSIKVSCELDDAVDIKLDCLGTSIGGSDNTFINRKAGSGNVAEVTCKSGSGITGLSGGDRVESLAVKGGEPSKRYVWLSGIVVPKNHTLCLCAETGASKMRITLSLHFCECI